MFELFLYVVKNETRRIKVLTDCLNDSAFASLHVARACDFLAVQIMAEWTKKNVRP